MRRLVLSFAVFAALAYALPELSILSQHELAIEPRLIPLPAVVQAQSYSATTFCTTSGPNWTAFGLPACEGFGCAATGGCQAGRTHLVVDTLTDVVDTTATTAAQLASNKGTDGKISFREAVKGGDGTGTAGPRLVTFSVNGYIALSSDLNMEDGNPGQYDNLTIDGGDAPGQGVAIRDWAFFINTSNVIIRFMRFRRGDNTATRDNIAVTGPVGGPYQTDFVFDHLSLAWADDGNIDFNSQAKEITLQWCNHIENMGSGHNLIASGSVECNVSHPGPTEITLHHNFFHQGGRTPEVNTGSIDFRYNVIYRNYDFAGAGATSTVNPFDGPRIKVNYVGNYWKQGSDEANPTAKMIKWVNPSDREPNLPNCPLLGGDMFVSGNIAGARPSNTLPELDIVDDEGGYTILGTENDFPDVTTSDAFTARDAVIAGSGATLPCSDAIDIRVKNEFTNGTGNWCLSEECWNPPTLPPGGYPDLTEECASQPGGGGVKAAMGGKAIISGKAKVQGFGVGDRVIGGLLLIWSLAVALLLHRMLRPHV